MSPVNSIWVHCSRRKSIFTAKKKKKKAENANAKHKSSGSKRHLSLQDKTWKDSLTKYFGDETRKPNCMQFIQRVEKKIDLMQHSECMQ